MDHTFQAKSYPRRDRSHHTRRRQKRRRPAHSTAAALCCKAGRDVTGIRFPASLLAAGRAGAGSGGVAADEPAERPKERATSATCPVQHLAEGRHSGDLCEQGIRFKISSRLNSLFWLCDFAPLFVKSKLVQWLFSLLTMCPDADIWAADDAFASGAPVYAATRSHRQDSRD